MKLIIMSVHDSKAGAFISPFFTPTVAVGLRSFGQAVNDPETNFYKFPGDYTLFELGSFDIESGVITLHPAHINHGLALVHQHEDLSRATAQTITELRKNFINTEGNNDV